MKKYLSLLLITLSFNTYSFTLVGNAIATFSKPEITVNVGNSSCPDSSDTPDEILELVGEAISQYWNTVPYRVSQSRCFRYKL